MPQQKKKKHVIGLLLFLDSDLGWDFIWSMGLLWIAMLMRAVVLLLSVGERLESYLA